MHTAGHTLIPSYIHQVHKNTYTPCFREAFDFTFSTHILQVSLALCLLSSLSVGVNVCLQEWPPHVRMHARTQKGLRNERNLGTLALTPTYPRTCTHLQARSNSASLLPSLPRPRPRPPSLFLVLFRSLACVLRKTKKRETEKEEGKEVQQPDLTAICSSPSRTGIGSGFRV